MHSNSFVLAVKSADNKILREIGGQVFLTFNSEYSLLLKNLNNVKSCCTVSIDGTDVLGGHELIVEAHSSIDLERFVVDGNFGSGRRFKFVPLTDSKVQDPSSAENGIVEVRFWKEKVIQPIFIGSNSLLRSSGVIHPNSSSCFYSAPIGTACCDSMATPAAAGATVEGAYSNQQFGSGYFGEKDGAPTVLRLKLVGQVDKPLTVEATKNKHCTNCGRKAKFNDYFCGGCGKAL